MSGIGEAEADRGTHEVGAAAPFCFIDNIAETIHDIGVVAEPAAHGVGAGVTVDGVVVVVAVDAVIEGVAGRIDCHAVSQDETFDGPFHVNGVRETEVDAGDNRIGAVAAGDALVDDISGVVNSVLVTEATTDQPIGATAAVQHIAIGSADDGVVLT